MSGHGHVVPRADGAKASCGGPALCDACTREYDQVHGRPTNPEEPESFEIATSSGAYQNLVALGCWLTQKRPREAVEMLYRRIGLSVETLLARKIKGLSRTESRRLIAETCRWLIEVLEQ